MSRRAAGAVLLLGSGVAAYHLVLRPWHLQWGATAEEVARPMTGDDIVAHPQLEATRVISIHASPEQIWPWLVQMGYKRAGFYAYRFDNAWRASPRRLVPELQQLSVGDVMPTGPEGGFTVAAMEPRRSMLLVVPEEPLLVSCSILLDEVAAGETRMIGRLKVRFGPGYALFLYRLLFDPGDFIMMRKMFLGIKERAEAASALFARSEGRDIGSCLSA
jgi:hypothetical protein